MVDDQNAPRIHGASGIVSNLFVLDRQNQSDKKLRADAELRKKMN